MYMGIHENRNKALNFPWQYGRPIKNNPDDNPKPIVGAITGRDYDGETDNKYDN